MISRGPFLSLMILTVAETQGRLFSSALFPKPQRNRKVFFISPALTNNGCCKIQDGFFSTVQFHVIVNSVSCCQCYSGFMVTWLEGFSVWLSFSKQDLQLFLMLTKLVKYITFYSLNWVNDHYYATNTMSLKPV